MKNLVTHLHHVFPNVNGSIKALAFNSISDKIYVVCGLDNENPGIEIYEISENDDVSKLVEFDSPSFVSDNGDIDEIQSMQFLGEPMAICLSLKGGDIVMVKVDPSPEEAPWEIIGNVENGIVASCWSTDEQVFCIITGGDTILFMTKNFDIISETSLSDADLNEFNKHISVGWGRSETQFRGKRVRAKLRDPTLPEKIDEGKLSDVDDGKTYICWRGDSQYVSINRLEKGPRRAIRVYSREGLLDSISEPQDGQQSLLSWKPSGSVLATIKSDSSDNSSKVIFFERNGLRHGEFSLRRREDEKYTGLAWNVSSSILAVSTENSVMLWTTGNYHWYLKKEINIPQNALISWHPEHANTLYITGKNHIEKVVFDLKYVTEFSTSPNDFGLIPVIDGSSLLVTPLSLCNIPPPMCRYKLSLDYNVQMTSINATSDMLFAADDRRLTAFTFNSQEDIAKFGEFDISTYAEGLNFKSLLGLSGNQVLLLADGTNNCSKFFVFQCDEDNESLKLLASESFESCILNASYCSEMLFFQTSSGKLISYNLNVKSIESISLSFPKPCSDFVVVPVHETFVPIGLTSYGRLYAEQRLLSTGVLSFFCTERFVLFTTTKNLLKFVHLVSTVDDLQVVEDDAVDRHDERCRVVERGSKIVTSMPSKMAVVLQMPRGNLETIYPRIMVLDGVRTYLKALKYGDAFKVCRTHRLDLNILFDYDPDLFLKNIPVFVDGLYRVDYLDLFLTSLKPENVTTGMYSDTSKSQSQQSVTTIDDKVNLLCKTIREHLISKYGDTHFQAIITSYLCESPPKIEAALGMISGLIKAQSETVDLAIEHMCFLVDVNMLFDHALGLYDLKLALLIAQQSQKDPREYVPFLHEFQKQESLRRKFNIDCYLKRYERALGHLKEMENAFDEFKNFTIQHKLYPRALELYKYDKEAQKEVLIIFAQYLRENGKSNEAAIAYESVGKISEAIEAYKSAGMWRECLSILQQTTNSEDLIRETAEDLASLCIEKREHCDAGSINLLYLSNPREAVIQMCKGTQYSEAIRIARATGDSSIYKDLLISVLGESFGEASELVADFRNQIKSQTERILVLREKKKEDPISWMEGTMEDQTPDDISLASTSLSTNRSLYTQYTKSSNSSKMTRNTSKNNRRLERKRARGKKGTVFEEEYLVNSLRRLIARVEEIRPEVHRLLEALVRCNMTTQASELQRNFANVIGTIGEKVIPILSVPVSTFETALGEQPQAPVVPNVKPFEKLSILI